MTTGVLPPNGLTDSGYSLLSDSSGAPMVLGHGPWGPAWKAFHRGLQCHAALKVIPHAHFEGDSELERYLETLQAASTVRHSHLTAVFPPVYGPDSICYAREIAEGDTLRAYLGTHQSLGIREALHLAEQIAAALEVAARAGLYHGGLHASNVLISGEDGDLAARVVDLGLPNRGRLATPTLTPPEQVAGATPDERWLIYSLGALLYGMLHGLDDGTAARPLTDECATMPEAVLSLLQMALHEDPAQRLSTVGEFRAGLTEALTAFRCASSKARVALESQAAAAGDITLSKAEGALHIPESLLTKGEPGELLTLKGPHAAWVMATGDVFRVGRQRTCDLVTRFLPRSPENDARTWRLSKVQCLARAHDGKVLLFDGDGQHRSTNGSRFEQRSLGLQRPAILSKPGRLLLADDYPIWVEPLLATGSDEPTIANSPVWPGPVDHHPLPVNGAVIFTSDPSVGKAVSIWLLSEVAFGIDTFGALDWQATDSETHAGAFRYYRGCFWLECSTSKALSLDGIDLCLGDIVPLVSGQKLQIASASYQINVAAPHGSPPALL